MSFPFLPFSINLFRFDVVDRVCRSVQNEDNEDTQISNDLSGATSQAGEAVGCVDAILMNCSLSNSGQSRSSSLRISSRLINLLTTVRKK